MSTIETVQKTLTTIILAGAIFLGVEGYREVKILRIEVAENLKQAQESSTTAISAGLNNLQKKVDPVTKQTTATLKEAQGLIADLRKKIDPVDIAGRSVDIAFALQDISQSVASLSDSLVDTSKSTKELLLSLDEGLKPFLDCAYEDAQGNIVGGNPDCAFNRFQGSSKSFERAMKTIDGMIEKQGPAIAASAQSTSDSVANMAKSGVEISNSVAAEAKSLTAPQTKLQQVRGYILALAKIYGAL